MIQIIEMLHLKLLVEDLILMGNREALWFLIEKNLELFLKNNDAKQVFYLTQLAEETIWKQPLHIPGLILIYTCLSTEKYNVKHVVFEMILPQYLRNKVSLSVVRTFLHENFQQHMSLIKNETQHFKTLLNNISEFCWANLEAHSLQSSCDLAVPLRYQQLKRLQLPIESMPSLPRGMSLFSNNLYGFTVWLVDEQYEINHSFNVINALFSCFERDLSQKYFSIYIRCYNEKEYMFNSLLMVSIQSQYEVLREAALVRLKEIMNEDQNIKGRQYFLYEQTAQHDVQFIYERLLETEVDQTWHDNQLNALSKAGNFTRVEELSHPSLIKYFSTYGVQRGFNAAVRGRHVSVVARYLAISERDENDILSDSEISSAIQEVIGQGHTDV